MEPGGVHLCEDHLEDDTGEHVEDGLLSGSSNHALPRSVVFKSYLVWGELALVRQHPPQAGHGAEQRHGHADPQVPLAFGAEHQSDAQQPDEDRSREKTRRKASSILISVSPPPLSFFVWILPCQEGTEAGIHKKSNAF